MRDVFNAIRGFIEREKSISLDDWQRMRIQTAFLVNIHSKKKIPPKKLFPIPELDKPKKSKRPKVSIDPHRIKQIESMMDKELMSKN